MIQAYNSNETAENVIKGSFAKFIVILISAFIVALVIHGTWIRYINIYHTILELFCVFIAMLIFVSIWYNYERNDLNNCILAYGFLLVAAFDALHTFYFLKLNLSTDSYFDLSTRYWVVGRFAEAVTMLLFTEKIRVHVSKWIGLIVSVLTVLAVSYFFTSYHDYLPILLTNKGTTHTKVILEYIIIGLYIFSLFRMRHNINHKSIITYEYIFISLLIAVSSELCFTFYSSVQTIPWNIGHVLKIVSYYLLFRGIFVSTVIYPYDSIEAEHKKLEKAHMNINKITETLSDILDSFPMAVFMYDDSSVIKYVNKKFEELFGCHRKDIYGKTTAEFVKMFPLLKQEQKPLNEMMLNGDPDAENVVRTYKVKSGEYKKLYITSNKIRGGVIALLREAKEEQALKNMHLQTETILNSVSSGILMIDNDKKIILCNKAFENMSELSKEQIIGMNIEEFNKIINYTGEVCVQEALNNNVDDSMKECTITTLGGNNKELLTYTGNIKNVDGEIIGAISVSTDVTEMKKEELKIQQQEKLALLGQLGAGIVHETRNYLTTIKGRCQLIDLIAKDEKVKEYAQKIDNDVNEVNRIISEFLFLSKPRETQLEEVSMYDIVQSLKNILESTSLVKGVNVSMEISKEERYLLCDEIQIKQVILNICKNAVDAMTDEAEPKLDIITGYDEKKNEMFIKIKDNGKGMSQEVLEKVGTMFYTTKKNGTGLGLNMCNKIIKEHRGRIKIESKPKQGSTFTVILPCIEDTDEDEKLNGIVY